MWPPRARRPTAGLRFRSKSCPRKRDKPCRAVLERPLAERKQGENSWDLEVCFPASTRGYAHVKTVAHCISPYLQTAGPWVYEQVCRARCYRPIVLTQGD